MKFHPEGLEFLKSFGTLFLVLAAVALRFSSWPGKFFIAVIERVARNFPAASLDSPAGQKKKHKQGGRLSPAQLRQGPTARDRGTKRFDWFLGLVAAYGLLDWLVLPTPYRLSEANRWPVLLTLFVSGTTIIFIGSQTWDERLGWKKGTFWISLLATVVLTLGLARWLRPLRPGGVVLVLMAAALAFFWLFGTLRRIDRNRLELRGPADSQT